MQVDNYDMQKVRRHQQISDITIDYHIWRLNHHNFFQEHETWCKQYLELYQELRENWERLYWDEGYSKKIAEDRANYDSAEEDDLDFSPYRQQIRNSSIIISHL